MPVFDVDSVLRRSALRGASVVGRDGAAVVSMAKRILARGPSECVRHAPVRLRARTGANAFAGTYRVRLPPHFEDVAREGLAGTSDGINEHMAAAVRARGVHRIVSLPEMGSDSLDVQNPDCPRGGSPAGCGTGPAGRRGGPRRGKGRGVPAAAPGARLVVGRVAPWLGRLQGR